MDQFIKPIRDRQNNEKYHIFADKPIYQRAYTEIRLARDVQNNTLVVVKIYNKQLISSPLWSHCKKCIKRECSIQSIMQHENIVKILDVFESEHFVYIFLEKCDMLLLQYLQQGKTEAILKTLFHQLIEGMQYMKENNYYHLDIKPENIFILNGKIKIGDFGLSTDIMTNSLMGQGTPKYMSPEQLNLIDVDDLQKHDIWAVGVMLYELIYEKHPYAENQFNVIKIAELVQKNQIQYPDCQYSKQLIDLISHMLDKNLQNRYSWQQCLQHSWFQ